MDKKGIKVHVDYSVGVYYIEGYIRGNKYNYAKPIKGMDKDMVYKKYYSSSISSDIRRYMQKAVFNMKRKDTNFKYSNKLLKKVDPVMFATLQDWDKMAGTNYAFDYLKTAIKEIDNIDDKEVLNQRKKELEDSGINISYNVGLINASDLSLIERIKGIIYSRRQKELLGVNVHYSTFVNNEFVYEDEPLGIQNDQYNEELFESLRNVEKGLKPEYYRSDDEILEDLIEVEKGLKKRSQNVKIVFEENSYGIHNQDENLDLQEEIEVVDLPIKEVNNKRKRKVKNHAGTRTNLTRKQKIQEMKKNKRSETSFQRNARLKEEKELKRQRALEEIRQAKEQKEAEEQRKIEIQRIMREQKEEEERRLLEEQRQEEQRKIEFQKILEEKKLKEEQKKLERKRKILATINSATGTIKSINNNVKKDLILKTKHWTRKIDNIKDSIKNKKFKPHLGKRIAITGLLTGIILVGINYNIMQQDNNNKFNQETTIEKTSELTTKTYSEIKNEVEKGSEVEAETKTKTKIKAKSKDVAKTEIKDEAEFEAKDEIEVDAKDETQTKSEVETEAEMVAEINNENEIEENKQTENNSVDKEKVKEFIDSAIKRYEEALIIGENTEFGDLFSEQTYSENPDGTGIVGNFDDFESCYIDFINIILDNEWKTVRLEGKTLHQLLEENPDYITYNIHFNDKNTGYQLGFITEEQYSQLIQNKIKDILESKSPNIQNQNDMEVVLDDVIR